MASLAGESNPLQAVGTHSEPRLTKVMHVVNGQYFSGAERVQDLLAKCLPGEGFQVGFACVRPDLFPEKRECREATLYKLPMRSRFDLRPARQLAQICRTEQYELIHAHTPRSALIARAAATLTGLPMVYHVHSPTSADSTNWLRNRINNAIESFSLSGVKRLICVSHSLGDHMRRQGFTPDRVSVVPNGVGIRDGLPSRSKPEQHWTLGTVALIRPRKGIEVLLAALSVLIGEGEAVRLRAVGPFESEEYQREILQLAVQLGVQDHVDWVGFTSDVNAELDKIDLFVMPSLFGEGLPMVVLEAMASGVPVVGTRVEGIPEAVREFVDGVIAKPNDPDDLADAIQAVIHGDVDWTELSENARMRQIEHFSDRSMAAGVAACYRELLPAVSPSRETARSAVSD